MELTMKPTNDMINKVVNSKKVKKTIHADKHGVSVRFESKGTNNGKR